MQASIAIHLQAIGTEMNFILNGGGYYFQGPSCVVSDVESPLAWVVALHVVNALIKQGAGHLSISCKVGVKMLYYAQKLLIDIL